VSLERIEITPFAVIVGDILQNRLTGYLTIVRAPLRKVLYWSQGELVLIISSATEESLADFLIRRGVIGADRTAQIMRDEPVDVVSNFHEAGILELSWRQTLLREWVATLFVPLFSLDEGTAVFTEDEAIPPDKRVFLQSSAALVIEGIRSITNGLVLRRSLGDLKREITWAHDSRYNIDSIPLTDPERTIASQLRTDPQTIESFLKQFTTDSVTAAKVVISLMAIGMYSIVEIHAEAQPATANFDEMQRDLELLAAIGASDQRSLRAVALSRQMVSMDHYQLLDVPRAATRAQIMSQADEQKRKYDPMTYPPIVRDAASAIGRRIDEAVNVLKDANRRAEYDKLLADRSSRTSGGSINQRLTQRSIAEQNFVKARELAVQGDYYGAIVLLKQAVEFAPDNSQAWYLLGSCQERNPKWRRDAAESYQMALSIDPNFIDAMISLGDVYKLEGMISRAQTCYEDVLRIAPENQQAKSRVQALKRR
jgi:tetratricopeptide (TPR) repeat protein